MEKASDWSTLNHSRNIVGPKGSRKRSHAHPEGRMMICHLDAGLSAQDRRRFALRIVSAVNDFDPMPKISDAVVLEAARQFCGGGLVRCGSHEARMRLFRQVRTKLETALREGV